MVTLLITVALGIIIAIFSTQNTGTVSLNFLNYVLSNVPIYLAILVPLLIGLIAAFFIHLTRDLSQKLTLSEEGDEIKRLKKELAEVTKEAHKFQIENGKLKSENGNSVDQDSI